MECDAGYYLREKPVQMNCAMIATTSPKPAAAAKSKREPLLPSRVLKADSPPTREPMDAYYDSARKEYLSKNTGNRWLAHNEAGFKRLLKSKGFRTHLSEAEKEAGETLSLADHEILRLQNERDVTYAAPLAGRDSGFYEENGQRFLVTEGPRWLLPVLGEWSVIRTILSALLASEEEPHGETQFQVLLGWLAVAVQSLYRKSRRPGQALVLAGPAGCGKSVIQNQIITPLLGGRSAKCAPYLQGRTDFNGELFGAEHLMLEDESAETCIRARLALASHVKQVCVNEVQPCHAKHRPIINLRPFWRLSISLNDEPERLLIIPPLASDIADKLHVLRCAPIHWPIPVDTSAGWQRLCDAVSRELPAFLHFLLEYKVAGALHSDRYGVRAWHHPALVKALEELAPEAHLAELIVTFLGARTEWTGTSSVLRMALQEDYQTGRDARDLLKWPNACGTYLGRLAEKPRPPLQVTEHRTATVRQWHIILEET